MVLRELLREGHTAVAFEQEMRVGGTWVYVEGHGVKNGEVGAVECSMPEARRLLQMCSNPGSERRGYYSGRCAGYAAGSARTVHTDILPSSAALHASPRIHSSMYKNLRTNLPRELMGYADLRSYCVCSSAPSAQLNVTAWLLRRFKAGGSSLLVLCHCTQHRPTRQCGATYRFTNFPFTTDFSGSKDARRFCGHAEVVARLRALAACLDLQPHCPAGILYSLCLLL